MTKIPHVVSKASSVRSTALSIDQSVSQSVSPSQTPLLMIMQQTIHRDAHGNSETDI